MTDRYDIPAGTHSESITVKKSKFIATLSHAGSPEQAKTFINEVRSEYTGATHHCWAYVAGPPGSSAKCGMSDDGEPHGTAGRPMLNVLLHADIGEIVAVVTRYYGGTKLGTGGLVRAYGGIVRDALEHLERKEKRSHRSIRIEVPYADLDKLKHLIVSCEAKIIDQHFTQTVALEIQIPEDRMDCLDQLLKRYR